MREVIYTQHLKNRDQIPCIRGDRVSTGLTAIWSKPHATHQQGCSIICHTCDFVRCPTDTYRDFVRFTYSIMYSIIYRRCVCPRLRLTWHNICKEDALCPCVCPRLRSNWNNRNNRINIVPVSAPEMSLQPTRPHEIKQHTFFTDSNPTLRHTGLTEY